MKEIAAARFKVQRFALLDQVEEEGIVIPKHGKPVAKLIPIRAESATPVRAAPPRASPASREIPPTR